MKIIYVYEFNKTWILALVFLSVLHPSVGRECEFVSEGPKMCGGTPYFEHTVSTPGFCEKYRCQTDSRCDGFTFFPSDNRCALYENCDMDTLVDCDDEGCLTGLCSDTVYGKPQKVVNKVVRNVRKI